MKVVALISGGKDSCFNMMQCIAAGHEIVALANLYPIGKDELDSFMFQTVGYQGIEYIAEAIGLPLYRESTFGKSKMQEKSYRPTENDEVEDLYRLLARVKDKENIEAVSSGAILSDYQRTRVENVCNRLGLVSLSYLWQRKQEELLKEMIDCSINAIIIKVAALGLEPRHLGKSISELQPHLLKIKEKYGVNVCGEGGEYETFTLDCPLFAKNIVIDEYESVVHANHDIAPVGYLNFKKIHLQDKNNGFDKMTLSQRLKNILIKAPYDYISEIVESELQDGCSLSDNENEDCQYVEIKSAPNLECIAEEKYYVDKFIINTNKTGWYWFGGIIGDNEKPDLAIDEALEKLSNLVKSVGLQMTNIIAVTLYVKDISKYASINEKYIKWFNTINPPVRVCLECEINVQILLDAVAYNENHISEGKEAHKRHTLHVQSISHWAPANIGPYSQVIRVGDIILVAGQIPLVPGSMNILDMNIKKQCRLTLRHINRIVNAIDSSTQLRNIVQGICFVTHPSYIPDARKEWEKRTNNAIVDYVVVPKLPRNAHVEWCVWAHRDNNRFEYEETGKCVGDLKVAIRRRWNYENNVSAIVCYLSKNVSNVPENEIANLNTCFTEASTPYLEEIFEYLLYKLTKGSQNENPSCNLRIFYKIGVFPGFNFLYDVLSKFSSRNLVITIIPATHLHNSSTFLSICGIRHE